MFYVIIFFMKNGLAMERLFAALADRTRLRLLNLMADGEVCVCYFVEVLQMNQPNISRHLAYLKSADIVAARRDGKWMHYRIIEPADEAAARIFREVRNWLLEDKEMKRDRSRLQGFCCAPVLPEKLQGAPRPMLLSNGKNL